MLRRRMMGAGAALATGAFAGAAGAQTYPARPIRLVVPFAPGGNLDLTARVVAEPMARTLGQSVVVENRAGAGGVIGADAVAKAAPDGYTIAIVSTGTVLVSPRLTSAPPYNRASFDAIGMISATPMLLEVPAASRFKDYAALIAHLRANPGGASVGHAGNGTTNHITLMRLQDAAGVKFNVVPYRGSGPALNDLIAGQIDSCVDQVSSSLAHIKAGKLRPLAVTTAARVRDLPDVPTLQELGLKDFESVTAAGLVAPAKTPPPVLAALNAALAAALADPGVRQRLSEMGADPRPMTPAQFDAFMVAEAAALEPLFASGVLKPE